MKCRYITKEGKSQQEHLGTQHAPGVFTDMAHPEAGPGQTRVCIHQGSDENAACVSAVISVNLVEPAEAPAPPADDTPPPGPVDA